MTKTMLGKVKKKLITNW